MSISTTHWSYDTGARPLGRAGSILEIHTDGSAHSGDTRQGGGWAWVCYAKGFWSAGVSVEGEPNSRSMETQAVLEAVRATHPKTKLVIHTDCANLVDAWNALKNGAKIPESWEKHVMELEEAANGRKLELRWVKGHARCLPNRVADRLAYHSMVFSRENAQMDFTKLAGVALQVEKRLLGATVVKRRKRRVKRVTQTSNA